jgi:hypothetical protein
MKLDANGNCACPPGTFWSGRRCANNITLRGPGPTIGCKPPRPVGTWPNCCPQYFYFSNGVCRPMAALRANTIPSITRQPQISTPKPGVPVTIPQVTRTQQYVGDRCPRGTYYLAGLCRQYTLSPTRRVGGGATLTSSKPVRPVFVPPARQLRPIQSRPKSVIPVATQPAAKRPLKAIRKAKPHDAPSNNIKSFNSGGVN